MKIKDIVECVTAKVCVGEESLNEEVKFGFASDLMSDVLTIETDDLVLITGLTNLQSIRTAEMSDIKYILFVRNKKVTPEMLELASDNGMVVLESPLSMFRAIGELYKNGLKPIY
jgi:hypothetical protein